MTDNGIYAVDFFCGAGGLTRGLLNAGIKVVVGIDSNAECKETYERNNKHSQFILADVRQLKCDDLGKHINWIDKDQLLFAACAPCQPFAQLNKSEKDKRDESALLLAFAKCVEHFLPAYVFLENVPGLAKIPGFSTLARFRKLLRNLGYKYDEGTVDAKKYGVPQTRRRYILIACRLQKPTLPEQSHGPGKKPYKTVQDVIKKLPPLQAGECDKTIFNHVAARISEINLSRLRLTPKDGGDRRSWPKEFVLQCHKGDYDGHTDVYGRMAWNKPAPTLTCKCNSISNGRYGHPEQDRAISLREAAALQSFAMYYRFYGSSNCANAKLIGNAVPAQLARAVGRHIRKMHKTRFT